MQEDLFQNLRKTSKQGHSTQYRAHSTHLLRVRLDSWESQWVGRSGWGMCWRSLFRKVPFINSRSIRSKKLSISRPAQSGSRGMNFIFEAELCHDLTLGGGKWWWMSADFVRYRLCFYWLVQAQSEQDTRVRTIKRTWWCVEWCETYYDVVLWSLWYWL